MTQEVIIAAGGSGGHVLPAQVVAQQLHQAGAAVSFAAHGVSKNPFLDHSLWPCHDIPSAPLSPSLSFLKTISRGIAQAMRLLRRQKPGLVVGFGSYHAFPVLAAASLLRIPLVLYAADAIPGRTIRLFAPLAQWTGCFFQEAQPLIRGRACHVDFPIREPLRSLPSKQEGCRHFGVDHAQPCILVLGGSQGAGALNAIIPPALGGLDPRPSVIHLAGQSADIEAIRATYQHLHIRASVAVYEPHMEYAFAAADLVVARSGASTIAEIEACAKPAVYIPYPRAMDDHQKKNATLAAARGRAIVLDEAAAGPSSVAASISRLLEPCEKQRNDPQQKPVSLAAMIIHTLDQVSVCRKK